MPELSKAEQLAKSVSSSFVKKANKKYQEKSAAGPGFDDKVELNKFNTP